MLFAFPGRYGRSSHGQEAKLAYRSWNVLSRCPGENNKEKAVQRACLSVLVYPRLTAMLPPTILQANLTKARALFGPCRTGPQRIEASPKRTCGLAVITHTSPWDGFQSPMLSLSRPRETLTASQLRQGGLKHLEHSAQRQSPTIATLLAQGPWLRPARHTLG